jgi:cytochrome P450/NADPH-cytochrome P450 reductase
MLVLGMVLQRFEFVDYLNYELKVKEGLTIKPEGLLIKIKLRPGRTTGTAPIAITTPPINGQAAEPKARPQRTGEGHNTPLMVLFGSNLGTAEGIATRVAQDGSDRGYAVTLGALDDHTGELPHEGALVVVCASYNGHPPDNADRFCRWITDAATPTDAGSGLAYSVFGCGNMDWASTYQAVPTLIDAQLEAHGARRVHARGEGDARSDFDGQFSEWYSELWSSLGDSLALSTESTTVTVTEPRLRLTMENKQTTNPVVMSYRAHPSTLVANRELLGNGQSASDSRSARHIELELPAGMEYQTGDHLGILPRNNVDLIRRVMARFGLDAGTYVSINPTGGGTYTHLPLGEPAPLLGILGACVELQDVASRSDLAVLARYAASDDVRTRRGRPGGLSRTSGGPAAVGARATGRIPQLQPALQCLLGATAAHAASVLLHLLFPRGSDQLPSHGRSAPWSRPQRRRVLQRSGLQPPGKQHEGQHSVHLCSQAHHPLPAARQPTHPDDHGRGRNRDGALPRVPAGTGRHGGEGRPCWEVDALLRLPLREG